MAWLKTKLNIHHLDVMNMPCPWRTTWLMASGFTKHKVLSNFKLPSGKTVLISSRWSGGSSGHPHPPSFLVVHHAMVLTTIDHPNMAQECIWNMNMYEYVPLRVGLYTHAAYKRVGISISWDDMFTAAYSRSLSADSMSTETWMALLVPSVPHMARTVVGARSRAMPECSGPEINLGAANTGSNTTAGCQGCGSGYNVWNL